MSFNSFSIARLSLLSLLVLTGCGTDYHTKKVADENITNISVGKVQKEISVGMPGGEVIAVLGSPNIVTKNKEGKEVWVYDKLATNFAFSNAGGELSMFFLDGGNNSFPKLWGGQVGGGANAGATRLSQKTLTLIIKMSSKGAVEDFTYHASSF